MKLIEVTYDTVKQIL